MLKNYTSSEPEVLHDLKNSEFEFFLTGSRLMGDPDPNDWDFYVEDTDMVRSFLNNLGFFCIPFTPYQDDPNVAEVWAHLPSYSRLQFEERFNIEDQKWLLQNGADIHIQIVQNIEARHACTNIMRTLLFPFYAASNKQQRRALWQAVFEAYQKGMKHHG